MNRLLDPKNSSQCGDRVRNAKQDGAGYIERAHPPYPANLADCGHELLHSWHRIYRKIEKKESLAGLFHVLQPKQEHMTQLLHVPPGLASLAIPHINEV